MNQPTKGRKKPMAEDKFDRELKKRRQISITVVGRRSGRTLTLPVWFVSAEDTLLLLPVYGSKTQWYRNLLKNPGIDIRAGSERRTLQARALRDARVVRKVIQEFRDKYTPEMITRLYPGPLDAAVKVRLQPTKA
jgi:deazaflavin-dependent oxidoreductase (nitroreductase family)